MDRKPGGWGQKRGLTGGHPSRTLLPMNTPTNPKKQPEARLVLTITETAGALGISRTLAYELVRRGELPAIRLGRRIVVPRVQLNRLVQAGDAVEGEAS